MHGSQEGMPGIQLVFSWRDVIDFETPILSREGGVRAVSDKYPSEHPVMRVALYPNSGIPFPHRDFLGHFGLELRLGEVKKGSRGTSNQFIRVDVVEGVITIEDGDLSLLWDQQKIREKSALLLVQNKTL